MNRVILAPVSYLVVAGVIGETISGLTVFITPKTRTWAQQFRGVLQRKRFVNRVNATAVKTLYPRQRCMTLFRTFSKKGWLIMAEYISRDAAIRLAEDGELYAGLYHDRRAGNFYKKMKRDLLNIPAADVRPVVRGKWTRVDYEPCGHDYICSECGCKSDGPWNFCHDCGADMREVKADG